MLILLLMVSLWHTPVAINYLLISHRLIILVTKSRSSRRSQIEEFFDTVFRFGETAISVIGESFSINKNVASWHQNIDIVVFRRADIFFGDIYRLGVGFLVDLSIRKEWHTGGWECDDGEGGEGWGLEGVLSPRHTGPGRW